MNKKKVILVIVGLYLFLVFIFIGIIFFKNNFYKKNKDNFSANEQGSNIDKGRGIIPNEEKKDCLEGWIGYRNDVLGIGFCYLEDWGLPHLKPIENLTLLEGAVDEYSKDDYNTYNNSIYIDFEKNNTYQNDNKLELHFFNDNYKGEYYPNSQAYDKGCIDNIARLKETKDICKYEVNFTELWENQGRMTEFWSECEKGVKDRIVNHEQFFDKNLYSYSLESLAYLKLQNNFFDNLLIKKKYLNITQVEKKINNVDDIFEAKNYPSQVDNSKIISKDEFLKQKKEFSIFLESFYRFSPQAPEKKQFQVFAGEEENISILRKYYWLIENQKIEDAYQLHNRINITLDDFKKNYSRVNVAEARDFKKINGSVYKFFVDFQEHNKPRVIYRISARVLGSGKIEIITTEEIVSEMVKFDNYLAYAKKENGKIFLILERYGVETVIDEGAGEYNKDNSNLMEVKSYRDIFFSKSGKYLVYKMIGWEWGKTYIYDIENSKLALEIDSGFSGFTKNEDNFFVCNSDGMANRGEGTIYNTNNFNKKFELLNKASNSVAVNVECQYNEEKDELIFVYNNGCEMDNKECKKTEVIYSFIDDKMVSAKVLDY